MIALNYTGAHKQDATQIEPLFSLGGFLSSSQVANDFFSNLFGEITLNTISNKSIEHVCVALVPSVSIENITLTIKGLQTNQGRFRVAAVIVEKDDCGVYNLPKMQNTNSKPVNLSFSDCNSFFGETLIEFSQQQVKGTLFDVVSGVDTIGEFIYSDDYSYAEIYSQFSDDFEFKVRFDYDLKTYRLYLIQKNIDNFNAAIEIVRQSDSQEVGDVTNQLPVSNIVSLGDIQLNEIMALYFERTISKETIRENSKLNCEKFFDDYEYKVTPDQDEVLELEINYAEIPTTPSP